MKIKVEVNVPEKCYNGMHDVCTYFDDSCECPNEFCRLFCELITDQTPCAECVEARKEGKP